MAVPKRKISRRRRDLGRTHYKIQPLNLSTCPNCSELKKPHEVCRKCGKIKNQTVLDVN